MNNFTFENPTAKFCTLFCLIWLFNQTNAIAQVFWKPTNTLSGGTVYALAANTRGHIFAGTIDGGVFRSTNKGETWEQINNGLTTPSIIGLAIFANNHIWAGTNGGGAFRSMDNGDTWTAAGNGITDPVVFSFASYGGHIFAATLNSGVFRSSDNGLSWQPMNNGLFALRVFALAVNAQGVIFAGCFGGIFASVDSGSSWINLDVREDIPALAISADEVIFAGHEYGQVFRSLDGGQNWKGIRIVPIDTGVRALAVNSRGHVFAGTFGIGGVFRSKDNGDSWEPLNNGLTDLNIFSFTINPEGHIFAGSSSGNIFQSIESTTAVQERSDNVPTALVLHQNYPNPFNPGTAISFFLPRSAFVTLKIYNTAGIEVATLVSDKLAAGEHRVQWQAQDMPTGVYFYRLHAGSLVETRKLLIVR